MCACVCMCACMCVCVNVRMYVCVSVCVSESVCERVCVRVCTSLCLWIKFRFSSNVILPGISIHVTLLTKKLPLFCRWVGETRSDCKTDLILQTLHRVNAISCNGLFVHFLSFLLFVLFAFPVIASWIPFLRLKTGLLGVVLFVIYFVFVYVFIAYCCCSL